MNYMNIISALLVTILIGICISPFAIPMLRRLKFGQSIREEGPKSHMQKTGTPTMGGIIILISLAIGSFIFSNKTWEYFWLLFVTFGYGLIGFLDDFIKIKFKRNLGLTAKQKALGQLAVALISYLILRLHHFDTTLYIPGTSVSFNIGWFYLLFIILFLVGTSNALNLTDGLDGLLSGTSAIAFTTYAIIAICTGKGEVAIFSASVVGATLAFLFFNKYPAKVFMGDTGSLALGGALAGIAILTKTEILLAIIGGVFVIETLSVILQVSVYKITKKMKEKKEKDKTKKIEGKRLFKMSPIHHHFEENGWSEWKVVISFWIIGIIFATIGISVQL